MTCDERDLVRGYGLEVAITFALRPAIPRTLHFIRACENDAARVKVHHTLPYTTGSGSSFSYHH